MPALGSTRTRSSRSLRAAAWRTSGSREDFWARAVSKRSWRSKRFCPSTRSIRNSRTCFSTRRGSRAVSIIRTSRVFSMSATRSGIRTSSWSTSAASRSVDCVGHSRAPARRFRSRLRCACSRICARVFTRRTSFAARTVRSSTSCIAMCRRKMFCSPTAAS